MSDEFNPKELIITIDGIKAYRKAYSMVSRESIKDLRVARAAPVLLAFCVEKALKGVAKYHDHKPPKNGHNLVELFERLDENTQAWIIIMSGKPRHFWRAIRSNAEAFVKWRYIEEPQEEVLYFVDDHTMLDIVDACLVVLYRVAFEIVKKETGARPRSRKAAEKFIWQNLGTDIPSPLHLTFR